MVVPYIFSNFAHRNLRVTITLLVAFEITLVVNIFGKPKPSVLDVYRGKTELEITSVNGTPIDTVVVLKKNNNCQ